MRSYLPLTRRNVLEMLFAVPVGAAGGCCLGHYPKPLGETRAVTERMPPILRPTIEERQGAAVQSHH